MTSTVCTTPFQAGRSSRDAAACSNKLHLVSGKITLSWFDFIMIMNMDKAIQKFYKSLSNFLS